MLAGSCHAPLFLPPPTCRLTTSIGDCIGTGKSSRIATNFTPIKTRKNLSMDLYGRKTAVEPSTFVNKKYQYFNSRDAPLAGSDRVWGLSKSDSVVSENVECRPMTWGGKLGSLTARVKLSKDFTLPCGKFSGDIELFVLSGSLRIGNHVLRAQSYSYIPSGQQLGSWSVLENDTWEGKCGALDHDGVELLWMENSSASFAPCEETEETDAPSNDFIPALDATRVGWAGTQTSQFSSMKKKWLRRGKDGSGVWLLCIDPHYDSATPMLQNYNEEGYCISGYCDIGEHRFTPGYFGYIPHGTVSPRHKTLDGCLFFIRVDRDLTTPGSVASLSLHDALATKYDWTAPTPELLPGPGALAPKGFTDHIGCWEGTYHHIGVDGKVNDFHYCKLEIGIHGNFYSQRNTYQWKDDDGNVTKEEVFDFPGYFDRSGIVHFDTEKIIGWGKVIDSADAADGTIIFYGAYKAVPHPDTFDLIRMFGKDGSKRYRTWQVKLRDELLKVVHVTEFRTSRENYMWLPRT